MAPQLVNNLLLLVSNILHKCDVIYVKKDSDYQYNFYFPFLLYSYRIIVIAKNDLPETVGSPARYICSFGKCSLPI